MFNTPVYWDDLLNHIQFASYLWNFLNNKKCSKLLVCIGRRWILSIEKLHSSAYTHCLSNSSIRCRLKWITLYVAVKSIGFVCFFLNLITQLRLLKNYAYSLCELVLIYCIVVVLLSLCELLGTSSSHV